MAEAATLVKQHTFEEIIANETRQPLVIPAGETGYEKELRLQAAQFIGSVAAGTEVMPERVEAMSNHTLLDAIRAAACGDAEALAMVRLDVTTDVIERTIKKGHITHVDLQADEEGNISQYGQTDAAIQRNSLRFADRSPKMKPRTKAETRNMFRLREAYRQGLLEDYVLAVFSRVPDDMSEAELEDANFYTDSMSCAIQMTSLNQNKLSLETAFVAGKTEWDAPRHDRETLNKVSDRLGVDFKDMDATGVLDSPLFIHKSLVPNGVVDLVKMWDDINNTFFGEAKPRQDYLLYRQQCKEREASYTDRIDTITKCLIAQASNLTTPQEACRFLNKLSAGEMIEQSIVDTSIDPLVFGVEAAYRIEHARYYMEMGHVGNIQVIIEQAKQLDTSSSCPGGVGKVREGTDEDGPSSNGTSSSEGKTGDCEFISKKCPKCHKKNVKTVVKSGHYYGACGCHT